jgi:hypothetical protein
MLAPSRAGVGADDARFGGVRGPRRRDRSAGEGGRIPGPPAFGARLLKADGGPGNRRRHPSAPLLLRRAREERQKSMRVSSCTMIIWRESGELLT